MKSLRILLPSFLLLCTSALLAQGKYVIEGVVTDAESGETLPFASVFIASTTYGVASDDKGKFSLELPAAGTYDLIISFTGYETFARSIRFLEPAIVPIEAKLVTKSREVVGAVVTSVDAATWKRRLAQFKLEFLGISKNGMASKILNEEVLNFSYDRETDTFEAFAYEALIIENKNLGYRVRYLLEGFRLHSREGYSSFYGFASFEELKKGKVAEKYIKERNVAYLGSQEHFFSALYAGTTRAEGYEIYRAKDMEGGGRMFDQNQLRAKKVVSQGDNDQTKKLEFEDILYIYYKKEPMPKEYYGTSGAALTISRGDDIETQKSWIIMREEETAIHFESNGYVVNPLSFFSYGLWSFEKVADMMPLDYQVTPTEKSKGRKR